MQTKSTIQLIKESCEKYSAYNDSLNDLMNRYMIEDSIFVFKNNQIFEVTKGYFEKINSFNSLTEALSACKYNFEHIGIRIVENKTFEIGHIRKTISECSEGSSVLDIDLLNDVK